MNRFSSRGRRRRETLEGAGVALANQYKEQGLEMLRDHAQFEDGSVSVEAGLMEMLSRMETGRFKVFKDPGAARIITPMPAPKHPHKTVQEYRQLAERCREMGRTVSAENERAEFLARARTWDRIADRLGRAAPH